MSTTSASRPSQRSLARLAGVSPMTVSLALRNHPSIPGATRQRIQRLAAAQGYRVDPQVAKLMHHLRTRRTVTYHATLAALRSSGTINKSYSDAILEGAVQQATALGYKLDVFPFDETDQNIRVLQNSLLARGIEGILLLPVTRSLRLWPKFDWKRFSVVSATHSVLHPRFHTVMPDQFSNMMRLCARLAEEGYRRIGFLTHAEHDVRLGHRFTGAIAWHHLFERREVVRPLILEPAADLAEQVRTWLARQNPDVVIFDSEGDVKIIRALLPAKHWRDVAVASISLLREDSETMGVWEDPRRVGEAAAQLLSSQVQRGEKGIPTQPVIMMLEGAIVAAKV